MKTMKDLSQAKIYTPPSPDTYGYTTMKQAYVKQIELTREEASAQGWHFRYKSRRRIRITRYTGSEKNITIPAVIDGCIVNEIGRRVFAGRKIVNVRIPGTVKKLMPECFAKCTVETAIFAEGVSILPERAFLDCNKLSGIHLPQSLRKIGREAFMWCTGLKFIDIPSRCIDIGGRAFKSSGLEGFTLNGSMITMMYYRKEYNAHIDGSAFDHTPLTRMFDLVVLRDPCKKQHDILCVGYDAKLRFPKCNVRFLENSINGACELDLTRCNEVILPRNALDPSYSYGLNCCKLRLPLQPVVYDLPNSISSNFYGTNAYRWNGNQRDVTVSMPYASMGEHVIDSRALVSIYFKKLRSISGRPTEVFSPDCVQLHKVSWTEGEKLHCVYIPNSNVVDRCLHRRLLKAFTVHNDADGNGVFFDQKVIDDIFLNRDSEYKISKTERVLIAADVLRSTHRRSEDSTDMYIKFLRKNRNFVQLKMPLLTRMHKEYADFLTGIYRSLGIPLREDI